MLEKRNYNALESVFIMETSICRKDNFRFMCGKFSIKLTVLGDVIRHIEGSAKVSWQLTERLFFYYLKTNFPIKNYFNIFLNNIRNFKAFFQMTTFAETNIITHCLLQHSRFKDICTIQKAGSLLPFTGPVH